MPLGDIVGHRRLSGLLSRAIARQTLPPSLLFAGPAGVGKWRTAWAVAQAVNCTSPVPMPQAGASGAGAAGGVDACGVCQSCKRIARGVHVDVLVLEPDDMASIKIQPVRDVLGRTDYRPFEGRRRVVLVREADSLTTEAQNAMLKSLEEPPAGTIFILTTAVPGVLLPTVRSRCMRLAFSRLTEAEVADVLVTSHGFARDEALGAAALAGGSVGQALDLGSSDLGRLRKVALDLLRKTAPRPAPKERLGAASLLIGPSKKERSREELKLILRLVASMLRDVEVLNTAGPGDLVANRGDLADLEALQRPYEKHRARDAFGAVDRALFALERNAGVKVVSEWLAMQL